MKNYYYLDDINEVQGPLPLKELDALYKARRITASTQVCEEGTENWTPFFQVVYRSPKTCMLINAYLGKLN